MAAGAGGPGVSEAVKTNFAANYGSVNGLPISFRNVVWQLPHLVRMKVELICAHQRKVHPMR